MATRSLVWEEHKAEIICDYEAGLSDYMIAKKWRISAPAAKRWRNRVSDEIDPPTPVIIDPKKMRETVDMLPTRRFLEEQGITEEITERFKEKGLNFLNNAIDRMEELLKTTKDIRAIAAGINVLMPYLMARVDGADDQGGSLEARRSAFVQNIQNNYNLKISKDETVETIGNYRDSEEPAPGD